MHPVPEWRRIIRHAWSVRLLFVAAILSGLEAALPYLPLPIPPGALAGLTVVVVAAAFVARIVAQKEFNR